MSNQDYMDKDTISFVELAAIFIRRRRIFYVTFAVVTLAGLIYAMTVPTKFEYVTLLQSAQKEGGEYLDQPEATVSMLVNRWIPEVAANFSEANEQNLPFRVQPMTSDNTGLIRLASEAPVEHASIVKGVHEDLAERVIERQNSLVKTERKSLERRLTSLADVIETLQSGEGRDGEGTALAAAIGKRAEVQNEIESLKAAEALVIARQGTTRKGHSRKFIIALAVTFSAMLGMFLAYFFEFAVQVQRRLKQDGV